MDLTPAFLDRWREHRELGWMDRVRDVFDQAGFDDDWLDSARQRALARETWATLRQAGIEADETTVTALLDGDAPAGGGPVDAAVRAYQDAHRTAMAVADQQSAVTQALLDDLYARLKVGDTRDAGSAPPAALAELCDWLAAPPTELHPVVVAAVAHVELLRLPRWPEGNVLRRLVLLLLLTRSGYGYRGLLAPSTHWSDPTQLPATPAEELEPGQAETLPAVEHVVHRIAASLRDTVTWVRAEEHSGSLQAQLFAFPLQP